MTISTLQYYIDFAQAYGAGTYDSSTYGGSTTTGSQTGGSSNSGLTNTGIAVISIVTIAAVILLVAMVVRVWRRPSKQAAAEPIATEDETDDSDQPD